MLRVTGMVFWNH